MISFVCRHVETIEVYFLPVGHTHGQIDQMFSRLAVFLKRMPAKTLPELRWALYQAFNKPGKASRLSRNPRKEADPAKPPPRLRVPVVSTVVDSVVDIAQWLHEMMPPQSKVFQGRDKRFTLKDSHAFKLQLNAFQDVEISSKNYAVDPVWQVYLLFLYLFVIFFFLSLSFFRTHKLFSASQLGLHKH